MIKIIKNYTWTVIKFRKATKEYLMKRIKVKSHKNLQLFKIPQTMIFIQISNILQ